MWQCDKCLLSIEQNTIIPNTSVRAQNITAATATECFQIFNNNGYNYHAHANVMAVMMYFEGMS